MKTEEKILDCLTEAWNLFMTLDVQHKDELPDFKAGIHKCQYVIALRIARTPRPDIFPLKP